MDWRDYFDPISMAEPPYALADFDLIASLARERGAPEDENGEYYRPKPYELPEYWNRPQSTTRQETSREIAPRGNRGYQTGSLLDALLRQYPEFEAQFDRNKPNWGRYFDETYQTQGQRAGASALQEYLASAYGLDPSTRLTLDDWRDQDLLSRIQNDYAAMAGKGPSVPGIGYLAESPQSAQQNALRYAWEDEWAKRLSTHDYDPRYAQRATSFSPQFGGVYIDPFMPEGSMGALRERGFEMRQRPTVADTVTGQETAYGRPTGIFGQRVRPAAQVPELPEGATGKGIGKYFAERDKEQKAYLDEEMKERRKEAYKLAEEARKREISTQDSYNKALYKVLQDKQYQDTKTGGLNAEGIRALTLFAKIHGTKDWQEAERIALDRSTTPELVFLENLKLEHQPGYRAVREKEQREARERQKHEKEKRERTQAKTGLPRFLGLPVPSEYGKIMRGEAGLRTPLSDITWPSPRVAPGPGRDPFEQWIQEALRRQREGI